jgi:hypothetical protein
MASPTDRIFQTAKLTKKRATQPVDETTPAPPAEQTVTLPQRHETAAGKTYNYLRLGMLVAVGALGYSIFREYHQAKVHCLLGSISGYYYTPVRPVFVGVMIAIGLALIVIKGRTALEDAFLSLAGMMAPIVALIPTSDDMNGVCRSQMLNVKHYEPDTKTGFIPASIRNDLHALVFAGAVAVVLALLAVLIQWLFTHSLTDYTSGFWINLAGAAAVVIAGGALLRWGYSWVLDGHARAACAMFLLLAGAALTNCVLGLLKGHTHKAFALIYGGVGAAMIGAGLWFIIVRANSHNSSKSHLVLIIEAIEISLFVVFWGVQTIERWNETV